MEREIGTVLIQGDARLLGESGGGVGKQSSDYLYVESKI